MEDYKKLYDDIITGARKEEELGLRKKGNGNYYERHHILPKSLFPEHIKNKNNLVLLTAVEHFTCHKYLKYIYPGPEMEFALNAFVTNPNSDYEITAEEYAEIKEAYSKRTSERQKGKTRPRKVTEKMLATKRKNGTLNAPVPPEIRAKISATLKGRPSPRKGVKKPNWRNNTTWVEGNTPWNKGKKCETSIKKGEDNPQYGKHWYTNGIKNICTYECPAGYYKGRIINLDNETEKNRRQKISKATKGKHWFNNGAENKFCFECPEGFISGFLTPRVYGKKDKNNDRN